MEERLRQASRSDAPVGGLVAPRDASPVESRERRFLAMAVARPEAARPYLDGLPPTAFQSDEHRRAFDLVRAGDVDLDQWPDDLAEVGLALRIELAGTAPNDAELREAAFRVELPMLERRAAELRMSGDEKGRLEALELARRVRAALRAER
jgi:hypothetical protein